MTGIAPNAPYKWMQANDLPVGIPDDAHLAVDEEAGTITVEVFALDDEGRKMLHARKHLMTTMATYPLKVPPPPGLLDAYRHTVQRLRRQRDATAAIQYETAQTLIEKLNLDPIKVFEVLELPIPTERIEEAAL